MKEKLMKKRYGIPAALLVLLLVAGVAALSFVSFPFFFWCFIVGLCLWEGIAVIGERGWV